MKSTHKCEVISIELKTHPNADRLSIIPVFNYSYCGSTDEWKDVKKGVFCPPDTLVPVDKPEFSFLSKEGKDYLGTGRLYARIKAKKLRGVVSYGLLVPISDDISIGDDLSGQLETERYEPEISVGGNNGKSAKMTGGEAAPGPSCLAYKYDVDALQRYANVAFTENEPVIIQEKVHGTNSRYVYSGGKLYCGSRDQWKKRYSTINLPDKETLVQKHGEERANEIISIINRKNENPEQSLWWRVVDRYPQIQTFCRDYENHVLYGEVLNVQKGFDYGVEKEGVGFLAFDVLKPDGKYMDFNEAYEILRKYDVPFVPIISSNMPYNLDKVIELSEGPSLVPGANHIREGVVVCPIQERYNEYLRGRVKLKVVSYSFFNRR